MRVWRVFYMMAFFGLNSARNENDNRVLTRNYSKPLHQHYHRQMVELSKHKTRPTAEEISYHKKREEAQINAENVAIISDNNEELQHLGRIQALLQNPCICCITEGIVARELLNNLQKKLISKKKTVETRGEIKPIYQLNVKHLRRSPQYRYHEGKSKRGSSSILREFAATPREDIKQINSVQLSPGQTVSSQINSLSLGGGQTQPNGIIPQGGYISQTQDHVLNMPLGQAVQNLPGKEFPKKPISSTQLLANLLQQGSKQPQVCQAIEPFIRQIIGMLERSIFRKTKEVAVAVGLLMGVPERYAKEMAKAQQIMQLFPKYRT